MNRGFPKSRNARLNYVIAGFAGIPAFHLVVDTGTISKQWTRWVVYLRIEERKFEFVHLAKDNLVLISSHSMNRSARLFSSISGLSLVGSGAYFAYNRKLPAFFTSTHNQTPALTSKMTIDDKFEASLRLCFRIAEQDRRCRIPLLTKKNRPFSRCP